jgi:hypothetical protein
LPTTTRPTNLDVQITTPLLAKSKSTTNTIVFDDFETTSIEQPFFLSFASEASSSTSAHFTTQSTALIQMQESTQEYFYHISERSLESQSTSLVESFSNTTAMRLSFPDPSFNSPVIENASFVLVAS